MFMQSRSLSFEKIFFKLHAIVVKLVQREPAVRFTISKQSFVSICERVWIKQNQTVGQTRQHTLVNQLNLMVSTLNLAFVPRVGEKLTPIRSHKFVEICDFVFSLFLHFF